MPAPVFPFTGIVEQKSLKRALLCTAVNPAVGGLLISGPPGTGKSTAVRGLAQLMPEIDVVADCPFSCNPATPGCMRCRDRAARGENLPVTRRRRRVIDLPLNATEDRIAGTVDIARALHEGEKQLEPGLLAEANRGLLYVDEINLLDDHLSDILLDAAAFGVHTVEREGVSRSHPARFLLVGTMNPEEGELRPQLADRIGLHVGVSALDDPHARGEVLRRREAYTHDPASFLETWEREQDTLREQLAQAATALPHVRVPEHFYPAIAALVPKLGVHTHRADVTVLEGAKAVAALEQRQQVSTDDIRDAAVFALEHRLTTDPFAARPSLSQHDVQQALDDLLEGDPRPKAPNPAPLAPRQASTQ